MIKHVVAWRLKDNAEGADKAQNAQKIKTLLEGLSNKIDGVRHIEVGINIEPSDAAYDVVLISEFDDERALAEYQVHPEHVKVSQFISAVRESRIVVDYRA